MLTIVIGFLAFKFTSTNPTEAGENRLNEFELAARKLKVKGGLVALKNKVRDRLWGNFVFFYEI